MTAGRACAACEQQGRDAEDEGQRRHQDRAQPVAGRERGRLEQRHALGAQRVGELDDEDRVLRRQPDHGDQPHLHVDVARLAAQPHAEVSAQHTERNAEQHGERQGPALVLGSEDEEHDDEPQRHHCTRSTPRCPFLIRLPRVGQGEPFGREPRADQAVELRHHLAAAASRLRRAGHERRCEAVEPRQQRRGGAELGSGHSGQRDHGVIRPPHVKPPDVGWGLAEPRLGLRLHPIGAPVQVEVVDVER